MVLDFDAREGDRLDSLAHKFFHDPRKWWLIADANPDALTPEELVRLAHARGLSALAITDHDATAAPARGDAPRPRVVSRQWSPPAGLFDKHRLKGLPQHGIGRSPPFDDGLDRREQPEERRSRGVS